MATPRVLTSSPNETRKVHEGLPALEEPVEKGSTSDVSPEEEEGSCPVKSPKRSPRRKHYKHKARRVTFREETGSAKHVKGHARDKSFKCVACEKSFSKKTSILLHQCSHASSKGLVGLEHGAAFGQRAWLPMCPAAHLPKDTQNLTWHMRKQSAEAAYCCQKCMKIFLLHENFLKHQKIHLPPAPGQAQAGNPCIDQKGGEEDARGDHLEFLLEEVTKIRKSFDLLIINQQVQLQVLQGIQRQLDIVVPSNDLINSSVYSLGLLLRQQASAIKSLSVPFFRSPRDQLPKRTPHFSC